MGRVQFKNNYRFILDGVEQELYATTDRQAWYMMFQMTDGEVPDVFIKIDEESHEVKDMLE